ncbi:MAG: DUF5652 family protein [Nanoarchaeota archaeon]
MNYFLDLADQIGISIWLLLVIIVWSLVWKAVALFKSARNNHIAWFVIFLLINTIGILEIIYIFVFSKMKFTKTRKLNKKKPLKRKSKIKRKRR